MRGTTPTRWLAALCATALLQLGGDAARGAAETEEMITISAWDFSPGSSDVTWARTPGFYRYATSSLLLGNHFLAGVQFPPRAEITQLEFVACDESVGGAFGVQLHQCPQGSGPNALCNPLAGIGSGFGEAPGCGVYIQELVPPIVVDSTGETTYHLVVGFGGATDASLAFRSVHLRYLVPKGGPR